ncbi:MAG: hypothetical protein HUU35_03195 [Armatimonadetes bacterium]|nr:hypothetical protein [Armatimonadota bacterium]
MAESVTDWAEFRARWDGVHNFLMAGACRPFEVALPPVGELVDRLRADPDARISAGSRGDRLALESIAQEFRAVPLDEALARPFALAHFKLGNFMGPGDLLAGLTKSVLDPWREALAAAGFTWERCYPIIFISGRGCATNYHMDFSHVLACQVYGTKEFCSFRHPERWAPAAVRRRYFEHSAPGALVMPAGAEEDVEVFTMAPGAALWNAFLTPHWVLAGEEVAVSLNLSHGGLRLDGRLCGHEAELAAWRAEAARAGAASG